MYADRIHVYRTSRLWATRIIQSDCLSTAAVKCLFQCQQLLSQWHISVVSETNILIVSPEQIDVTAANHQNVILCD